MREGEFLVALDVRRSEPSIRQIRNPASESLRPPERAEVHRRLASLVERDWLSPTSADVVHRFDDASGAVKAVAVDRYDALVLWCNGRTHMLSEYSTSGIASNT